MLATNRRRGGDADRHCGSGDKGGQGVIGQIADRIGNVTHICDAGIIDVQIGQVHGDWVGPVH